MSETISKMVIEIGGKEYEFSGGGGIPGPDTVGTEQIVDGSVAEVDLSEEVKSKFTNTYDKENESLTLGN